METEPLYSDELEALAESINVKPRVLSEMLKAILGIRIEPECMRVGWHKVEDGCWYWWNPYSSMAKSSAC